MAGLLFGLLASSQGAMQSMQIPKEITFIIQGLIVVFIAMREGLRLYVKWLEKKKSEAKINLEETKEENKEDKENV